MIYPGLDTSIQFIAVFLKSLEKESVLDNGWLVEIIS